MLVAATFEAGEGRLRRRSQAHVQQVWLKLAQAMHDFMEVGFVPDGHGYNERAPIGLLEELRGCDGQRSPHREVLEILEPLNGADDVAEANPHFFGIVEHAVGNAPDQQFGYSSLANSE